MSKPLPTYTTAATQPVTTTTVPVLVAHTPDFPGGAFNLAASVPDIGDGEGLLREHGDSRRPSSAQFGHLIAAQAAEMKTLSLAAYAFAAMEYSGTSLSSGACDVSVSVDTSRRVAR